MAKSAEEKIKAQEEFSAPLSVKRLSLSNFRNYEHLDLTTGPENIVITGKNGAGKTTLLEAVSLLVPGRGIRNARIGDMRRQNSPEAWAVFASLSTPDGDISVGTGMETSGNRDKRTVKIEGKIKRGQAELAKHFSLCHLTPQMDRIFLEGSTARRSYLDRLTAIFYSDHPKHTAIYEHAKSERRKILAMYHPDEAWIEVLENRMARHAVAIAAARKEAVQHIQESIDKGTSSFPKAVLTITGFVEELLNKTTALSAEEEFCQRLKQSRPADKETGRANIGTHRSDFLVYHTGRNMLADLCSTGEQKALLISITLASARAKKQWSGASPVLLLDEIIAHLDITKRGEFFDELLSLSAQGWLTSTDSSFFKELQGKARFLTVENSVVLG